MSEAFDLNGLTIRARGDRAISAGEGDDGRLILQGQTDWLIAGAGETLDGISKAVPAGLGERLSPDLLLVNFGNAVGLLDLPVLGRVEIVSGKLTDRDFEWMLADLMDVASNLPFAANTATALPYNRSVLAEDVLYHAFVYLRHILAEGAVDRLDTALNVVLRDPHRRLVREQQRRPVEQAVRIEPAGLAQLITSASPLVHAAQAVQRTPLARALQGFVPRDIVETRVVTTLDTAENRFVKAFLRQVLDLIAAMRERMQAPPFNAFRGQILAECDAIERQLRPIVRAALWNEVGPMVHIPASSTVLQRRRGYREVFRHFARLRLAAKVPLNAQTVHDLLEAKDIALLYELWCYFAVVRGVEAILGAPVHADGPSVEHDLYLTLGYDLGVAWEDGTRVFYNATFSRQKQGNRRSYSLPLRPDITVDIPEGLHAGLHLFDAKFKVNWIDEQNDDALGDIDTSERRGTYQRGDLYKMHTYRDALPLARSVWALYPGDRSVHFRAVGDDALDGVGAVPSIPRRDGDRKLTDVLQQLLARDQ